MRILFKDNEFFIDNDLLFLKLTLQRQNKELIADIKKLLLKDYDLSIDGNLRSILRASFIIFKVEQVENCLTLTQASLTKIKI